MQIKLSESQDPLLTRRDFLQGAAVSATAALLAAAETEKPVAPPFLPGSDWPMYRHDPALSAESPITGGLAEAPSVAWSVDLGGPKVPSESVVVRDVTGDGHDDFLALSADSITCRDSRGQLRWQLDNFFNPAILAILDFAGDGSRGILLTTSRTGKLNTYLVNGRTGKAIHLWLDENNFGGHQRIGKLLPDVPGFQIAATSSGQTPPSPHGGDVRLVSFEHGLDQPNFRVREHVSGVFYSPLILIADLDGDSKDELVVISHEQIWAFDPSSGGKRFYAPYGSSIRTYMATVAAVKLRPDDAYPALVMINPSLPGLKAICQDGRTFARELWKVVIGGQEDQYQRRVTLAPAGTSLVYDPDGDGRYLVFVSISNEHGNGETQLVIFDALTGGRIAELPDAQVLAADDFDGDGKQELLLRRGASLQIARWKESSLQIVWEEENVQPVLHTLSPEGDLRLTSGSSPLAKGNAPVWREKDGGSDFLLRFLDGVHACRLRPHGAEGSEKLEKGAAITQHEALGNVQANPSERLVWDGAKLAMLVDGREVYHYVPPAPTTYLAPPPLVADLAGKRQILVRDSAGQYLLCSPEGNTHRVFLPRTYERPELFVDPIVAGPFICDIDGDGNNEVIATIEDAAGRPACVILDGNGEERRRINLLPGMTTLNHGPTGRLGPGRGRWILLRMTGLSADNERRFLVVAYDGRSGEQLWVRSYYGTYGANPVVFAAHVPSAVFDYDADGADDWLVCSENFYGIINVRENKDVVGPVILSDAVAGHWTAYSFPSVGGTKGGGKPAVFHHGAFSLAMITDLEGRPLWHFGMTRDTAGKWGQFVDVDGDGRREVIHVQPDGVLRCFAPRPSAHCPSCLLDATAADDGERWQLDMGRPVSRLIAADLDGDGQMEVVFGGEDGKLHALGERDGKPQRLWSIALGRRVGEPVIVDLDGDGRPEILVTAEDGKLYCLKGQ